MFSASALRCGVALSFVLVCLGVASAQTASFARVTSAEALPNGVELRDGEMRMRITALRGDVLRIRASRNGMLPEDASWAVLTEARTASAQVTQDNESCCVGFHTQSLRVSVERATGLLTVRDGAGHVVEQDAQPLTWTGAEFRLRKVMPEDEHYFGLGDKTGSFDRRSHAFSLWNTDAYRFQESTDPIYKSIPFFLAYRAGVTVGTLMDNTWRSSFDFGTQSPTSYSFGAVDGPVDYYIFLGPTPRQAVETYAWLTGKAPLPPLWTLGFQQSRYSYMTAARVMEVAERFRTDHIPADAIYLDIDYQDRNRPFTVNTQTFPDIAGMLAKLRAMHFRVVAITDLHIAKAPGENYAPYESGIAGNEFVHNPDGSVYTGAVWPGPAVFPDFTRAKTREWWGTLYKDFTQKGFSGFWNDMNEPAVFNVASKTMPLDVVHRIDEPGFKVRTATHAEIHDVFGMENSRATYEGLRKLQPDVRPFVLTRASYAGGQRYAATWTGDNSSSWNHLRLTAPMLKNLGLSGFSMSGADVGGFAGSATPELLTKWLEIAAFHPIDRDHTEKGSNDQEPWVGGQAAEEVRKKFIETRYRLMPYIYTVAEENSRTGLPMMRPLFLDYPDAAPDKHALDLDVESEFLLGHDLLIAPPPYPEDPGVYMVEFPTDEWYDFWTGEKVASRVEQKTPGNNAPVDASALLPLTAQVTPALDTLPVYVRGGAIVPMEPLVQSTEEKPNGPLTLRVYAGKNCSGALYVDDGISYAYQHGEYLRESFRCTVDADGVHVEVSPREGAYVPWWKQVRIEVYGWQPVRRSVELEGGASVSLETGEHFVSATVEDNGKGASVLFR